ncbi:MAG: acylphosphatase [Bacteroidetes bacterium]|nr:acylphosphatase [Bacteroidota bacterium]
MKTMHVVISGLVQGVGFRYFAMQKARAFGIRGYVRNLYTGEVEVVAQAEEEILHAYLADLRIGPRSAQVSSIRLVWQDDAEMYNSFDIRGT